jgi:hypothetical protein
MQELNGSSVLIEKSINSPDSQSEDQLKEIMISFIEPQLS